MSPPIRSRVFFKVKLMFRLRGFFFFFAEIRRFSGMKFVTQGLLDRAAFSPIGAFFFASEMEAYAFARAVSCFKIVMFSSLFTFNQILFVANLVVATFVFILV